MWMRVKAVLYFYPQIPLFSLSLSISSFHSNTTYSFPSDFFLPHLSLFFCLSLKSTALSTFVLCKRCMSQFLLNNIVLSGAILEYRKEKKRKKPTINKLSITERLIKTVSCIPEIETLETLVTVYVNK